MVATASHHTSACQAGTASNASPRTRSSAANAAAFTAVTMYPVTGVGAPSYTSGAHMWNGTAATLNPKPTSSNPSPISSIVLCCRPRVATCTPIKVRFVVAVAPYTRAMPYSRKPEANAPSRKYLSAASAAAALRRLIPAST